MINRKTKIIATIGPSSSSISKLVKMIHSGMDVARVNMSHYDNDEDVIKIVKNLRLASNKSGEIPFGTSFITKLLSGISSFVCAIDEKILKQNKKINNLRFF